MSQLETLIAVAVIGISSAIAAPVIMSVKSSAHTASLDSSLATLNSAVRVYLANGGILPDDADIEAVIAKLKTVRKEVADDKSVVTFSGSFIDPRTTVEKNSSKNVGIKWNSATKRFVLDMSDDRYQLVKSKEATEITEEERTGSGLSWGDDWIWAYSDTEEVTMVDPTFVSLTPEPVEKTVIYSGPSIKISPSESVTSLSVGVNAAQNAGFEDENGFNDREQTWGSKGLKAYTTEQENVDGWNTTASDGLIEVWQSGFVGVQSYEEDFHVEFNANEVSTLWQEVDVAGMDAVNISFAHGQRVRNTEQLRLMVGTTPPAKKANRNQRENLFSQGFSEILQTNSDAVGDWELYSDSYEVPGDVEKLYFAFQSVGEFEGVAYGNFLDEVRFEGVTKATLDGLGFKIDGGNSISNVIQSARIRLINAQLEDKIDISTTLPKHFKKEVSYRDNEIEITLTGKAFRHKYSEILESLTFTTTSTNKETRKILVSVNDGYAVSDDAEYLVEFD